MFSATGEALLTLQWPLNSHFALKIKEPCTLMPHTGQGFCQGKGGLQSRNQKYSATLSQSNYHRGAVGRGLGKITKTSDKLVQKPPKF